MAADGTLRVTIDLPGFYIAPGDTAEDAEVAMNLDGNQVAVVFIGFEGDSPQRQLRTLEGQLKKIEIRR